MAVKDLVEILRGLRYSCEQDISDVIVNKIEHDSRKIGRGDCYIALESVENNIDEYVAHAIESGASVIVTSSIMLASKGDIPIVHVDNVRKAYAIIAENYYGNPASKLILVGVIGTNGKTTCAKIISDCLNKSGRKCGLIGTLGAEICGERFLTNMTTPDPTLLNGLLSIMVARGVTHLVMEVSAHAIALDKVYGLRFHTLLYTNITQDHLDYFHDMERYSRTKLDFFREANADNAIVNVDDSYARDLLDNSDMNITTYGLDNPADIFAVNIERSARGQRYIVNCLDEIFAIDTRLIGGFNVYNSLGAIGALKSLGIDDYDIIGGLNSQMPISGRFNMLQYCGVNYVIDYAHTPDGLRNIIGECRKLANDCKVIVAFGCGGDRDKTKRPIMGDIVSRMSDVMIVTSDNPRSEDRLDIISDIVSGIKDGGAKVFVCPDRRNALEQAVSMASFGDVVLLAGKGEEKTMEDKGLFKEFNDENVLKEILGARHD